MSQTMHNLAESTGIPAIPAASGGLPASGGSADEFSFSGLFREVRSELATTLGSDWYAGLPAEDRAIVDEAVRVIAVAAAAAISVDWRDTAARDRLLARRAHVAAQLANLAAARVQDIADGISRAVAAVIQRGVIIALGGAFSGIA